MWGIWELSVPSSQSSCKTNTVLENEIYFLKSYPQFVSRVNPQFVISYFLKLGFTCLWFYNLYQGVFSLHQKMAVELKNVQGTGH